MKKFKKSLISALVSFSCLFSAVGINSSAYDRYVECSLVGNGYPESGYVSGKEFDKIKEEFGLIGFSDEFNNRVVNNGKVYCFPDQERLLAIEYNSISRIYIDIDTTDADNVTEFVNEIFDSSYKISVSLIGISTNFVRVCITDYSVRPETMKLAKELKEKLEQQYAVNSFNYKEKPKSGAIAIGNDGYLQYVFSPDKDSDPEMLEKLENYIEGNNIDADVELTQHYNHHCYEVVTNNMTQGERYILSCDIYDATGIYSLYGVNEKGSSLADDSIEIDMLNSIGGDANNDGQTTIADATAIVQALGNPDEYALSAQGKYNADSDSDGLTGMDAVRIQEILTQMKKIQ